MQRQLPNDATKTEAVHFPVDGNGKFDPKVQPYTAPPNDNKKKTVVPGKGALVALGDGRIPLRRRALEAREEYLDFLEELVARELQERDAEADAYENLDELEFDY